MPCEGKCLPFPRKLPFFVMQRKIWKGFGSSVLVHRATKVAYTYIKGFYFRNHVFLQIVKTYFRFRFKVNLLTPTVNTSLNNIEIRIGYEKITKFSEPLNDRNKICASIENLDSENGIFTINCTEEIMGRFLSIQNMTATPGRLELLSVKTLPEPSKHSNIKK